MARKKKLKPIPRSVFRREFLRTKAKMIGSFYLALSETDMDFLAMEKRLGRPKGWLLKELRWDARHWDHPNGLRLLSKFITALDGELFFQLKPLPPFVDRMSGMDVGLSPLADMEWRQTGVASFLEPLSPDQQP